MGFVSLDLVNLQLKALTRKLGVAGCVIYSVLIFSLYVFSLQDMKGWILQLNLLFLAILILISYLLLTIGDEGKNLGTDLMMEVRPLSLGECRRSESLAGIVMLVLLWLPVLGLSWLEIQHMGLGDLRERKREVNWEKVADAWHLKPHLLKDGETLEFIPALYEVNGMASDRSFLEISFEKDEVSERKVIKMNRFNSLGEGGQFIILPEKVEDRNGRSFRLVPKETVIWNDTAPLMPSLLAYGSYKLFLGALLLLVIPWVSRKLSMEMGLFAGVGFWIYYKVTTGLGEQLYEESLGRLERLGPVDDGYTNLWWEPIAHKFTHFSSSGLEVLNTLELSVMDRLLEEGFVAPFDLSLEKLGLLLFVLVIPPLLSRAGRMF